MIPEFPQLKPLELFDKEDIEAFTRKYPPYSDFNFVSMWSWDIKGDMRISQLNNNLVVRFTDYLTGSPFFSFLGDNMVNETVETLLKFSKKEGFSAELKLIPEEVTKGLNKTKFKVVEDRDHFDYVYSVEELIQFSGSKNANSRRLINNFIKNNNVISVKDLDFAIVPNRMQVLKLDYLWKVNKEFNFDNENEKQALLRLLNSAEFLSLKNIGVFIGEELVSFTLNEKLDNNNVMSFFAKFDINYRGSYLYSMKATAENLLKEGFKYINCEQDLGLPGLRYSKESLNPVFYLKKYVIALN